MTNLIAQQEKRLAAAKSLAFEVDTICRKCHNFLVETKRVAYCGTCLSPLTRDDLERLGVCD